MGRAVRWQAIIAFLGILLLAAVLASRAPQFTSITVAAPGGVYQEAVVGIPQAINPLLGFTNQLDRDLNQLIFQGLVRIDQRGEPQPALAERWEVDPTQTVYVFHLRRDVRWHDGAPFTAADVLYTVGVLQSDEFADPSFPAPNFLAELWRSVEATQLDDFTVQFRLKEPYAPFLYENTIGILPAHLWQKVPVAEMPRSLLNLQPVGTGPWRVARLDAEKLRLEPNPYADGPKPYLEAVEFVFHPDYASALAAFLTDRTDGVSQVLPQDLRTAAARPDARLLSAPLAGETFLYFNLANPNAPFFADKRVRQALWLALDQQALIDKALVGQGVPAYGPIMQGTWAYAAPPRPAPNRERAAQLLAEAGWVDTDGDGVRDQGGKPLAFVAVGDHEGLLSALAEQWAPLGVAVKPQVVNIISLAADYLSPRTFEAALVHWQLSGDPDPYPLWHSTQIENGQNYTGWDHVRADELMEQGRSTVDPGQRFRLYEEFQQIFAEELPALPLYFDVYTFAVNEKVKAVQVGRLNTPADRLLTLPQWYMVTQQVVQPAEGAQP